MQPVDFTTLAACCAELRTRWLPSRVEEVVQADAKSLALRLRTVDKQGWLHLSWHPTAGRVCVGAAPVRGAISEAFPFGEQVGSKLKGLVLSGVEMPGAWDRVVRLGFGLRPGEQAVCHVMCEVMGRYSNVLLTREDGLILACAYQVGERSSKLRELHPGKPYKLPPITAGLGVIPSLEEALQDWQSRVEAAATGLHSKSPPTFVASCARAYRGVSFQLLQQLCQQAGVEEGDLPGDLSQQQWAALHAGWRDWITCVGEERFRASLDASRNRYSVIGVYHKQLDSVHALLDIYYGPMHAAEQHASRQRYLTSVVSNALKKVRGKLSSLTQQLAKSAEAQAVRKEADLLNANLYRVSNGDSSIEVEDWDTGGVITLTWDSELSPIEASQQLYKRARKLDRGVAMLHPLMEAARGELEYLEAVETSLKQLDGVGNVEYFRVLQEMLEELVSGGYIKPDGATAMATRAASKAKKAGKKGPQPTPHGSKGKAYRVYTTQSGLQVLVGRNNKENDEISHRVAQPSDVWMHVRGFPGSHTLLRLPAGKSASQQDLQFAANLAAYYSKARNESKVEVIMANPKHLKKPKGARPGQVLVSREEVLLAVPGAAAAVEAAA